MKEKYLIEIYIWFSLFFSFFYVILQSLWMQILTKHQVQWKWNLKQRIVECNYGLTTEENTLEDHLID